MFLLLALQLAARRALRFWSAWRLVCISAPSGSTEGGAASLARVRVPVLNHLAVGSLLGPRSELIHFMCINKSVSS